MAVNIYGKLGSKSIQNDIAVLKSKIYGFGYPLTSGNRGFFSKQSGVTLVKNNLTQLLKTERGERVMLPNFGVSLKQYLFEPLDQTLFASIRQDILTSVASYMPNVEVVKLSVVTNDTIGYNGVAGLVVTLVVKLKEYDASVIEVKVDIN